MFELKKQEVRNKGGKVKKEKNICNKCIYGRVYMCRVMYGHVYLCRVMYGHVYLCMVMYFKCMFGCRK